MRKTNCRNKKLKYNVDLFDEFGSVSVKLQFCSYQEIVEAFTRFNSVDDIRNYFRFYKGKELKSKKTKDKYGNMEISKIKKVEKLT